MGVRGKVVDGDRPLVEVGTPHGVTGSVGTDGTGIVDFRCSRSKMSV